LQGELGRQPIYFYAFNYRIPLDYLARPDLELRHVDPPKAVELPRDLGNGVLVVLASDDSGIAAKEVVYRAVADDGPLVPELRRLGFVALDDLTVRGPDGYVYYRFFHLPAAAGRGLLGSFQKPGQGLVLANGLRLAGYRYAAQVQAGGKASLELLWDLPPNPEKYKWIDYNLAVHLVDGQGRAVAQKDWELWQYLGWRSDEYMVTAHEVEVPSSAGPLLGWLELGVYERYGRNLVAWVDANGKETGSGYKVGPVVVKSGVAPVPAQVQAGYGFGGLLELEGYDLQVLGRALEVGLHWRGRQPMAEEYVVSVQVLDSGGKLVGQADSPPAGGLYPTRYWAEGERVIDKHRVELPAATPAGEYGLVAVVYPVGGGPRLGVTGPAGQAVGDYARLGTIKIGGER
jgi:hypothetical protein